MDILLIWLVITPLFFTFGWFAGRIDMKVVVKQAKHLPKRLFDSIDALIDQQTSIATDEIKQVIDQEPQLIELQFSLGRLYRKRGENDLAIKLHTKLLASQFVLSQDTKDKIRLELAYDFHKAGLIDRAEGVLLQLLHSELYSQQAREMLLLIYQQDKNWSEAIETAKKLATSDVSFHIEVAQFNCELAQEAMIKSHYEGARQFIQLALATNRKCTRANILLGEIYFNCQDYWQAIQVWQLIEKQNYQYIALIIHKMFTSYVSLNKVREFIILIKGYSALYSNLTISDMIYQKLMAYDKEATFEYLRNEMASSPNAKAAALLIDIHREALNTAEDKRDAEQVKNLLLKYNDKLAYYRCGCCHFKSKTFFWQCPACYAWESIGPVNAEI